VCFNIFFTGYKMMKKEIYSPLKLMHKALSLLFWATRSTSLRLMLQFTYSVVIA